MKKIFLLPLMIFSLAVNSEVLWKPESISYELKQAHKLLGTGLMLELNQNLEPGETGWKQSRLDVPEGWSSATLQMKGGALCITVGVDEYYINSENMGDLSFAILDGGNKSDAQLLEIWAKYAKGT